MNRAPSYPRPDRSDQVRNSPESVSHHPYRDPRPLGSLPNGETTLCHVRKQHVKTAILEIVGKKIGRVVVKEADRSPLTLRELPRRQRDRGEPREQTAVGRHQRHAQRLRHRHVLGVVRRAAGGRDDAQDVG